jgi:hypothetical protein
VAETFDWAEVAAAAKRWMDDHKEAPKWLILPIDADDEILDLAEEIYDVPVQRGPVKGPNFIDHDPKPRTPPIPTRIERLTDVPILDPKVATQIVARDKLIAAAKAGTLTTDDVQRMSMEDYAAVRSYLLAAAQAETRGKTFGQIFPSSFKKITDITES